MSKKLTVRTSSKTLLERISTRLDNLTPEKDDFGTFRHARSVEDSPTFIRYVVKTGIRVFDDRVGGMPIGKSTELCGKPKSGKTNMAVITCVRAEQGFIYERIQTPDGGVTLKQLEPGSFNVTVLYYDNEGSVSDINNRTVNGVVMGGEILQCETVELLWKTMDEVMELIEEEQESTGILQFLIVVIDTVGSMTTKAELEAVWGKMDFPRVPAQLKAGFKAMTSRMQRENVLLIGVNHVSRRMVVKPYEVAYKGWNYDSPGGLAFSYFATHQIYFEMLEKKYCLKRKGEADGLVVYFLTMKNRMMPPLRQCHLVLLFGLKDKTGKLLREGGFNSSFSVLEALLYHKAAKVSKATGAISFFFEKWNVPMTTFGTEAVPSLDQLDDAAPPVTRRTTLRARHAEEKKKKDPKIPCRLGWPEFYEKHQVDFEALYEVVTSKSLMGSLAMDSIDPEEDDDEEEDNVD